MPCVLRAVAVSQAGEMGIWVAGCARKQSNTRMLWQATA